MYNLNTIQQLLININLANACVGADLLVVKADGTLEYKDNDLEPHSLPEQARSEMAKISAIKFGTPITALFIKELQKYALDLSGSWLTADLIKLETLTDIRNALGITISVFKRYVDDLITNKATRFNRENYTSGDIFGNWIVDDIYAVLDLYVYYYGVWSYVRIPVVNFFYAAPGFTRDEPPFSEIWAILLSKAMKDYGESEINLSGLQPHWLAFAQASYKTSLSVKNNSWAMRIERTRCYFHSTIILNEPYLPSATKVLQTGVMLGSGGGEYTIADLGYDFPSGIPDVPFQLDTNNASIYPTDGIPRTWIDPDSILPSRAITIDDVTICRIWPIAFSPAKESEQ